MSQSQHVYGLPSGKKVRFIKLVTIIFSFGLLTIFFQNCGKMNTGRSEQPSVTNPVPIEGSFSEAPPFLSLKCDEEGSFAGSASLTDADVIKYFGRISHLMSEFGYINKNGEPLLFKNNSFVPVGAAGTAYKWFDFKTASQFENKLFTTTYSGSFYCGVTTADKVVCNQVSAPFEAVEVAGLSGAEQVKVIGTGVCGLKNKVINCTDFLTKQTSVFATPEPIILLGPDAIVGASYKQYLVPSFLIWDRYPRPILNSTTINPYSSRYIPMCSQNIKSSSFPEFSNYVYDNGCALNDKGQLFCIGTEDSDGVKQSVSVLADGSFSSSLQPVDGGSYLAVAAYSVGSTCGDSSYACRTGYSCALKSDFTVSCFALKGGAVPEILKTTLMESSP